MKGLLESPAVCRAFGEHADAIRRSTQYVAGVLRKEEILLCGWPVISCNEWGMQQEYVASSSMSGSSAYAAGCRQQCIAPCQQ